MYGKLGSTSLVVVPAGAAGITGLEVLWYVVAAATLVAATFAVLRLLPRRKR